MQNKRTLVAVIIIGLLAGVALAFGFNADSLWLLSGSGDAGSGLGSLSLESLLAGSGDSGAGLG